MKATFHNSTRAISLHNALAIVACGIAMSTPAAADQSDGEALTKVVSYADLNLNSEPGARTLYGRLRMAATQDASMSLSVTYVVENAMAKGSDFMA